MKASVSKITCANRCAKKYDYNYVQKIVPIVTDERLTRGRLLHASLEAHYLKQDWTKPIEEYERKSVDEEEKLMIAECYRIMRSYLTRYRSDNFEVLAVEMPFEVETPDGNTYEGIIDLIYKDDYGVWVCDHKTVKAIPDESTRAIDMQTNLYFYATEKLGYNPTGIVFNYLRTKSPTQPKLLKSGGLSKAKNIDTDYETYSVAIKNAGLNPDDYADILQEVKANRFFSRIKVPRPAKLVENMVKEFDDSCKRIESSVGLYPRTFNMNCSWDCGYRELCNAEIAGIGSDVIRSISYKEKEERK